MPEALPHTRTWTSLLLVLLLLLLHTNAATSIAISPAFHAPSTSASAAVSANQRSVRSAEPASAIPEDGEGKDVCTSDFVEKFFCLLSGPAGKEREALAAEVLKILSENDQVNWPSIADWSVAKPTVSHDLSPAQLRRMFLEGARRIHDNEKRMAPKFNPTGWRRKRSVDRMTESVDSVLQGLLAKYQASELLGEDYVPKMAEFSDDVKLGPEIPEWQDQKRSLLPRRVSRRLPSQRMPKRKPLEFNPTGW